MTQATQEVSQATAEAPKPGSPEYDTAMAEKWRSRSGQTQGEVAEQPAAPAAKPQRPESVPEKFWDAEKGEVRLDDLLKSYTHAETEITKLKQTPATPAEKPKEGEAAAATTDDAAAQNAVANAGLNWDEVVTQVQSTGKLSDDKIAALEKSGIPRKMIDDVVSMYSAAAAAETEKAIAYAGGETELNAMIDWAAKNLSQPEIMKYNEMLGSPQWRVGMDLLKSKYAAGRKGAGEPSAEAGGDPAAGQSGAGYQNRDEMKRDMADPRYQKDAVFRREVEQKVANAAWRRR
jgi:hypothetical protein